MTYTDDDTRIVRAGLDGGRRSSPPAFLIGNRDRERQICTAKEAGRAERRVVTSKMSKDWPNGHRRRKGGHSDEASGEIRGIA